jgi:hypothetical protein
MSKVVQTVETAETVVTGTTPEKPAETVTTPEQKKERLPKASSLNWDDLPETQAAVFVRTTTSRYNPDKDCPVAIQNKIISSLAAWDPEHPTTNGRVQDCGNEMRAKVFVAAARKYCKAKGWTLLGGVAFNHPSTVRFSVRPAIVRAKPGAVAETGKAAEVAE